MIRHSPWLVVLIWGAASWVFFPTTAAGQDLLVANNTAGLNESIMRFSPEGEFLGTFAATSFRGGPVGLAFAKNGDLYVANHGNNTIHRYSSTGADLGVFASIGLSSPTGLAFDRQGRLVVCNYGNGALSIYSPTGAMLAHFETGLLNPIALAVAHDDNIFVSAPMVGLNSGVFRFSPDGRERTPFATGSGLDPRGLAFDREGHLYVADQLSGTVQRFTTNGDALGAFARTGLRDPFALAFDALGELYVSNQSGGTIRRYSVTGEDLGDFATVTTAGANLVGLAFFPVPEPTPLSVWLLGAGVMRSIARRWYK